MSFVLGIVLNFVRKNWLIILLSTAGIIFWNVNSYQKYQAGLAKGRAEVEAVMSEKKAQAVFYEKEIQLCEENKKILISQWNREVEVQKERIDNLKKEQKIELTKAQQQFRKKMEQVVKEKQSENIQLKESIASSDVVTAPAALRVLHDNAVRSSQTPSSEGAVYTPGDPTGVKGATETFEATAFTETLLDNIHDYNVLSMRYMALLELLDRWRLIADDHNSNGTKGASN